MMNWIEGFASGPFTKYFETNIDHPYIQIFALLGLRSPPVANSSPWGSKCKMNILFVDNFPVNFGISYNSSVLKNAGHDVQLLNYPLSKWASADIYSQPDNYFNFDKISDRVLERSPDVIGFSVFSPNFQFFQQLTKALKSKSDIPIMVGGVLPSLDPDLFLTNSQCDVVFRGEAEPVINDLVMNIGQGALGQIPNIVYKDEMGLAVRSPMTSYVGDLDDLPFCDKELYDNSSKNLCILTSRGCVMTCSFCSAGEFSKMAAGPGRGVVRKRAVNAVIDEIKAALTQQDYRQIYFYDDFFITSKSWLEEFAEVYRKEINIPYWCEAFPATVNDDIGKLLAYSGCSLVQMGFQTANDDYKKNVLKRPESVEKVERAIGSLSRHDVAFSLDHIFNFPGETDSDFEASLRFYAGNKISSLNLFFLNYYPDSGITKYAKDHGFLSNDVYEKVMRNEMIGEQSFKGTILDEELAENQVKVAFLFRLATILPASLVIWMWKRETYKFFPTNRMLYYLFSGLCELKGRGIMYLYMIIHLSFSASSFSDLFKGMSESFRRSIRTALK